MSILYYHISPAVARKTIICRKRAVQLSLKATGTVYAGKMKRRKKALTMRIALWYNKPSSKGSSLRAVPELAVNNRLYVWQSVHMYGSKTFDRGTPVRGLFM